jgi:rRNA biogenesis protein RRP5
MSEVVNITSVLPGMLVDSLVTDVQQAGLNLQVLGFFEGTINQFHLPEKSQRPGRKLKSRVLYVVQSTPPKLALSLVEHILDLVPCKTKTGSGDPGAYIQEAYPVGTLLEAVKVVRVESERGLIVEVAPHLQGYVHVRLSLPYSASLVSHL